MRELLFKAKNRQTKEWVEGYYVRGVERHLIMTSPTIGREVIPETVSQYTGLKDKNGVKIFENDILREYSNEIDDWIISYECGEFGGACNNIWASLHEISDLEVIGNVFDEEVK